MKSSAGTRVPEKIVLVIASRSIAIEIALRTSGLPYAVGLVAIGKPMKPTPDSGL